MSCVQVMGFYHYSLQIYTCTIYFRYPDTDQLQTVYGTYLLPVLQHSLASHPVWGSTAKVHALAGSMVQVYEQVSYTATIYVPYIHVQCQVRVLAATSYMNAVVDINNSILLPQVFNVSYSPPNIEIFGRAW